MAEARRYSRQGIGQKLCGMYLATSMRSLLECPHFARPHCASTFVCHRLSLLSFRGAFLACGIRYCDVVLAQVRHLAIGKTDLKGYSHRKPMVSPADVNNRFLRNIDSVSLFAERAVRDSYIPMGFGASDGGASVYLSPLYLREFGL